MSQNQTSFVKPLVILKFIYLFIVIVILFYY